MTFNEAQAALERAIALHQEYMTAPSPTKVPHLEQVISLYEEVLQVFTEQAFSEVWATAMNNLAIAYADLPAGDQGMNLARAIGCYEAAHRVSTHEDYTKQSSST